MQQHNWDNELDFLNNGKDINWQKCPDGSYLDNPKKLSEQQTTIKIRN